MLSRLSFLVAAMFFVCIGLEFGFIIYGGGFLGIGIWVLQYLQEYIILSLRIRAATEVPDCLIDRYSQTVYSLIYHSAKIHDQSIGYHNTYQKLSSEYTINDVEDYGNSYKQFALKQIKEYLFPVYIEIQYPEFVEHFMIYLFSDNEMARHTRAMLGLVTKVYPWGSKYGDGGYYKSMGKEFNADNVSINYSQYILTEQLYESFKQYYLSTHDKICEIPIDFFSSDYILLKKKNNMYLAPKADTKQYVIVAIVMTIAQIILMLLFLPRLGHNT